MNSIDKEIEKYISSDEFAEDCNSLKSEYVIKMERLPDDLTIERLVIAQKRDAFIIEKTCDEKGHIFIEGDEEIVDGKAWRCCQRCGAWFEKKGR
jgi:hypothetical protein